MSQNVRICICFLYAAISFLALSCSDMIESSGRDGAPYPLSGRRHRYLYVSNPKGDTVSQFSIDGDTGLLTPLLPATIPAGAWPNGLASGRGGTYLYTANNNNPFCFNIFVRDRTTGLLADTGAAPSGSASNDVILHPFANFAYFMNASGTISQYRVDAATGGLSALVPPTAGSGIGPYRFALHPSGTFLYAANMSANTLSMFAVNASTGLLAPLAPPTVSVAAGPYAIAVHPSGRYLYVAHSGAAVVSMFAIDSDTGTLAALAPATIAAASSNGIGLHPSGKFAYLADSAGSMVRMYSVDRSSGLLAPLAPPTVAAGSTPFYVKAHPNGNFVYVSNFNANTISMYRVDTSTGLLVPLSPAAVPAGNGPDRIVIQ
jgi:6-phosphogluconolactonase